MKLYAIRNDRSASDFLEEEEIGGNHSAGAVVLANNQEEARILLATYDKNMADKLLDEISLLDINPGVVLYANGEC